jgi:DNA polymerase I-like protein with 3'-5' exonuclease and polymerase domains
MPHMRSGLGGLHADFVSVEPAVTAHYSQDPSLLKVFRDGLGDVYLDLALTLFPNDRELREGYNPNSPVTSEVKERFKKQRKVAKIIQLAVQYTGTKYTVSKSLTFAGFPTSLDEADQLVQAYWKHFRKVHIMNETLFMKFDRQGYLRNAAGRIIRVPTHVNIKKKDGTIWEKPARARYKDLPNRFIPIKCT